MVPEDSRVVAPEVIQQQVVAVLEVRPVVVVVQQLLVEVV